jgi:hypothetical protein
MKRIQFVLVLLGVIALLPCGCKSVGGGAKYNYASGNLTTTLNADVDKSYDASLKALEQLELVPTEKNKDALGAKIVAKTSADKKIDISLRRIGDKSTELTIGIGTIGDKMQSVTIYDRIMENLK